MQHYVCSVYDKAVQAFLQPFFSPTLDAASRSVSLACRDPQHPFSLHPNDYSLVCLGQFDDASGQFTQTAGGFTTIAQIIQLMPQTYSQPDLLSQLINKPEA